jgi:hypothetical protein
MVYVRPISMHAVDAELLKRQRLQNGFPYDIAKSQRLVLVRDLQVALKIPYM